MKSLFKSCFFAVAGAVTVSSIGALQPGMAATVTFSQSGFIYSVAEDVLSSSVLSGSFSYDDRLIGSPITAQNLTNFQANFTPVVGPRLTWDETSLTAFSFLYPAELSFAANRSDASTPNPSQINTDARSTIVSGLDPGSGQVSYSFISQSQVLISQVFAPSSLQQDSAAVPEPTTMAGLALTGVGLLALRRKGKQKIS